MINGLSEIREAVLEGQRITVRLVDGVYALRVEGVDAELTAGTSAEVLRDLAAIVEGSKLVAKRIDGGLLQ